MITFFVKNHFTLLMVIGVSGIVMLVFGSVFILRSLFSKKSKPAVVLPIEIPQEELEELEELEEPFVEPVENKEVHNKHSITISSRDINAIAGDDVLATQLDLARAYIETGRHQLAKKILQFVVEQGTETQKAEAKLLLAES